MTAASFALTLRGVCVDYPGPRGRALRALDGIDLDVPAATFCAVIGPSGCGKSTALRLLGGLLRPTAGTVAIGGRDPAAVAADHRLGVAFQDHALLPWLTARENVALAFAAVGRRVDRARVNALLDVVGIRDFAGSRPAQLSGGMRQRVAIVRRVWHIDGFGSARMSRPGAVAEFEREIIKARTVAGIKAAKKRWTHVGRPKALVLVGSRLAEAGQMLAAGKSQIETARILHFAGDDLTDVPRRSRQALNQRT